MPRWLWDAGDEPRVPRSTDDLQKLARRDRIGRLLDLIGPGPVSFWIDAIRLMDEPNRFRTESHLLAHVLRELEGALLQVLPSIGVLPTVRKDASRQVSVSSSTSPSVSAIWTHCNNSSSCSWQPWFRRCVEIGNIGARSFSQPFIHAQKGLHKSNDISLYRIVGAARKKSGDSHRSETIVRCEITA